jgi:hypothetical protein
VGSPWDPSFEYRVYQLQTDLWGGLAVAVRSSNEESDLAARRQLLGLARETLHAVRIAVDFFNWDLEAHGQQWRLAVSSAATEHS